VDAVPRPDPRRHHRRNLSIAQAYISDRTQPQDRAKAFGMIGIAFGIGFFFGPAMAGWLSQYGLHVPFLVAACLSAGSMICTYMLLEASTPGPRDLDNPVPQATASGPGGKRPGLFDLEVYTEYFRRPGLGCAVLQFFCFTFAFSAFMSGFALFAERRFVTADGLPWTSRQVGFMFAYSGFLGIILQGGHPRAPGSSVWRGQGRARRLRRGDRVVPGARRGETLAMVIVVSTLSAYGNGVLRPVITSQNHAAGRPSRAGRRDRISGSLSSLAMTIAPPTGGILIDHGWLVAWTLVPAAAAALA